METLLAEGRLVTLTGVGGVGKTRLALETASRLLPDFADGVFWCDLSALTEPALVPRAVARLVRRSRAAATSLLENLAARLREAEVLLLLDNCEHLRDACAELAQALLPACPRLRLLATSREPLGAAGETDYPVPPLSGAAAAGEPGEFVASDAVSLFLARARAARPRLVTDDAALAAAGRICAELDGLPLAIELAAARAKALSFPEIEARLADRFRFLVSWRRLTPARHQTLREAMDWSYQLLAPEEQSLLSRLAVFSGGFTLEAAAAVCLDGDGVRALELVGRLVDASLVVPTQHDGVTRYRLLQTVRQYARERIGEQNERAGTERRLAQYVLGLVERTQSAQLSALQEWVAALEPERGNLRAALTWSRDGDEPEWLLRLVSGVWRFWWVNGDLDEGTTWLETALERDRGSDPALRAEALEGAAGLAWAKGDLERAREHADAALPLFTAAGDRRGEQAALIVLGLVALARRAVCPRTIAVRAQPAARRAIRPQTGSRSRGPQPRLRLLRRARPRACDTHVPAGARALRAGRRRLRRRVERPLSGSGCRRGRPSRRCGRPSPRGVACLSADALPAVRLAVHRRDRRRRAGTRAAAGGDAAARRGERAPQPRRDRTDRRGTLWEREQAAARVDLGEASFATAWAEGLALRDEEALDRAQLAIAG